MSQESVLREAVETLNRGDLDGFVACLHPDVEWVESTDAFPGLTGTYRGHPEVRQWAEQAVLELWANLELVVERIAEISDGGFLLETLITARGAASGIDTRIHAWQLFWFTDEQISRRQGPFWDRVAAIEAGGLSE